MDESSDQEQEQSGSQGGGLFDAVSQKGREYLSDPQNQEQIKGQVQQRFGNVPGMDQLGGLMGRGGQQSDDSQAGASQADASQGEFSQADYSQADYAQADYSQSGGSEADMSAEPTDQSTEDDRHSG